MISVMKWIKIRDLVSCSQQFQAFSDLGHWYWWKEEETIVRGDIGDLAGMVGWRVVMVKLKLGTIWECALTDLLVLWRTGCLSGLMKMPSNLRETEQ